MTNAIVTHIARSDVDMRQLPPQIRMFCECIGVSATLRLLHAKGGTQYTVPLVGENSEVLITLIGTEAAVLLCNQYGGEKLNIPKLDKFLLQLRNRLIIEESAHSTIVELARRHQLTTRQIFNILAASQEAPESLQGELF